MPKLLILGDLHAAGRALLTARADMQVEIIASPDAAEVRAGIRDADAVILRKADLRADALEVAGRLRMISRHGVGVDNIDLDVATARGIPVSVVGDASSASVAEHALLLMLAAARRLHAAERLARSRDPAMREDFVDRRNHLGMSDLAGRCVLVVGFGRIGRGVAKRCAAFDMSVIVADPFVTTEEYRHVADFRDALAEADVVVLCLPGGAQAPPLIGAAELAGFRHGAILVNVARGSLVDEQAVADALRSGRLRNAATDVWTDLPPTLDHPFLDFEDMVLTPHCAPLTDECMARVAAISVQNVLDYFDGRLDPRLVVNPEVLARGAGFTTEGR